MKYFYLSLILLFGSQAFSQELFTCYDEYRKVFENRGANPVQDGVHDNVILTIRTGDNAECYVVRVVVKEAQIAEVDVYFDDESYAKKEFDWKDEKAWSIHNGMSFTKMTKDDEMVNVMFTDVIKPKKKKMKTAPKPNFELN